MLRCRILFACFVLLTLSARCWQKLAPTAPTTGKWKMSGRVVDAGSGAPLEHAEVFLASALRLNEWRSVIAAEGGRFSFDNLDPGRYELRAQRKGYIRQLLDAHENYNTAVLVGPGLPSEDVVFRLRREASISGRVTDEQNEPVRNARVSLIQAGTFNGRGFSISRESTNTNAEGSYGWAHLPPGKYFIAITAEPWYAVHPSNLHPANTPVGQVQRPPAQERATSSALDMVYPLTLYPGVTDSAASTPIILSAGDAFTANIVLHAVPSAHVRIPLEEADLNRDVQLSVRQSVLGGLDMSVPVVTAQVAPGLVEVGGLAPGRYTVEPYITNQKAVSSARVIEISGNAESVIKVKDAPKPVTGMVKTEPQATFKGGQVALRDQRSGRLYQESISAQGEFEIKHVPPGSYDVLFRATGFLLKRVAATNALVSGQTVEIGANAEPNLMLIVTTIQSQVDGLALRGDQPLAGALILLVPEDPANNLQMFRRDQSNSDGSFNLTSVVSGRYTVLAIENGWELEWGDPKVLQPFLGQGTLIQVEIPKRYQLKVKVQKPGLFATSTQ
jgi:hypothetical protein